MTNELESPALRTDSLPSPADLTPAIYESPESLPPLPSPPLQSALVDLGRALPPTLIAEFLESHQPWVNIQYWRAMMDRGSRWEGLVVPANAIKHRYDIRWLNPLGRGTYGKVIPVSNHSLHIVA